MSRVIKYKEEEINKALHFLNMLEVKGISNANNLLNAYQIIQNAFGVEGEEDETSNTSLTED